VTAGGGGGDVSLYFLIDLVFVLLLLYASTQTSLHPRQSRWTLHEL
jgi:hypothetical protein